jgi:hypothetical protein
MVRLLRSRGILRFEFLVALAMLFTEPRAARSQAGVWLSQGPKGGNVYCLVADPSHPATLYAGTAAGVYKSSDGGVSWAFSGTGMPTARVQAIAIDPKTTTTLYAGTVTPNGVPSLGIFKSTDSGQTWTASNAGLIDPTSGSAPVDIAAVAIDPKNSQSLIAGTRFSEIFKSTDGGASWSPKTNGGFDLGLQVTSVAFDPSNSANVWAASNQGLVHSTDAGENWVFFGDAGIALYAIVIDPTNPSIMYAGDNTGFGIVKSTNAGNNWVQAINGLPVNHDAAGNFYPLITTLSFDPTNHQKLYACSYSNGIFVTSDSASSWGAVNTGLRTAYASTVAFPHGDSSAITLATLGAGFYQSTDGAQTWSPSSTGLRQSLVSDLAVDSSDPATVYAAAWDGVQKSVDGGQTWQLETNGLPLFPVSAMALVSGSSETLFAGTNGGGLVKSVDGGATWTASAQGLNNAFIGSITQDLSHSSTFYAGTVDPTATSQRVYASTDGGSTWTQTTLDASVNPIDFIAVNPANSAQVIAGSTAVAAYFQSLDTGKTWATVNPSTSCGGVNRFLFSPSGTTLYLAGSTGVCRTTDNGKTWSVSALGSYSASSLAADPSDANVLYAGTTLDAATYSSAVFRSIDGGQTWSVFGTGFPPATVTAINVTSSGAIRAGTRGGGVALLSLSQDRQAIAKAPHTGKARTVAPR